MSPGPTVRVSAHREESVAESSRQPRPGLRAGRKDRQPRQGRATPLWEDTLGLSRVQPSSKASLG